MRDLNSLRTKTVAPTSGPWVFLEVVPDPTSLPTPREWGLIKEHQLRRQNLTGSGNLMVDWGGPRDHGGVGVGDRCGSYDPSSPYVPSPFSISPSLPLLPPLDLPFPSLPPSVPSSPLVPLPRPHFPCPSSPLLRPLSMDLRKHRSPSDIYVILARTVYSPRTNVRHRTPRPPSYRGLVEKSSPVSETSTRWGR